MITARRAGVISTPGLGVYDVADGGILWGFHCVVGAYLNNVSGADAGQIILSLLFFEFNDPSVNAVQLHVNDAGAPV